MTTTIPFTQQVTIDAPDVALTLSIAFPSPEQVAANDALLVAGDDDFALQYRLRCCIADHDVDELVRRRPELLDSLAELVDDAFDVAELQ